MFGHLKAEDFTNLTEGITIPPRRWTHLEKCGRCMERWKAIDSIRLSIAGTEEDIIEPDWSDFRASVRDEMLSRAAKRSVETRRWSPWKLAPAGLSLAGALLVGLFVSRFFLTPPVTPPPAPPPAGFALDLEAEKAVWVQASAFDDVISLGPEESERFRELLENETQRAVQGENPPELIQ